MIKAVILLILYINAGKHVMGAQLIGSADNVRQCEELAATVISQHEKEIPKDLFPFPVCINTALMFNDDEDKKTADYVLPNVEIL